jgi:hypothetical protein
MNNLLAIVMFLGLMIIPFSAYARTEQTGPVDTKPEQAVTKALPVSQQLIPEGDFALKLVSVLKLGTRTAETQAEDMLTTAVLHRKTGRLPIIR